MNDNIIVMDSSERPENPFVGCQIVIDGRTEIYNGTSWKKIFTINGAEDIQEGNSYTLNIGNNNVRVTMGGVDVTSSVVSRGFINIPSVSGDIFVEYIKEL